MSRKELALEAISGLPDVCSMEGIVGQLRYLATIEADSAEIERGEIVPHEEVKRDIAAWRSE